MAAISPPSFLQNGEHSAASDRMTISSLLQPGFSGLATRGGVRATGDGLGLAVRVESTPNNTVTVKSGTCYVPASDGSGVYVCHNDADVVLTVPPASTTQARRDLVVAQVNDSTFSGTANTWNLSIVAGTPSSGTPPLPSAPSNALALGDYLVPAGTSTVVTSAGITDRRTTMTALGGVMPVLSTNLPSSPFKGMTVWCTDTEEIRVYNGSSWRIQSFLALPDPVTVYSGTTVPINAGAAATWLPLPTRTQTLFTTGKQVWVDLVLTAWLRATTNFDVRATLRLTGATTGAGTNGILLDASNNWGDVIYSGVPQQSISCTTVVPYKLGAGTTSIEVYGQRGSTGEIPNINYATIRIVPLRYA